MATHFTLFKNIIFLYKIFLNKEIGDNSFIQGK